MPILTKSKYLIGLQCPKYLWVLEHNPEKIPEPDLATQHKFNQGHLVGHLAKKWFPDGIDIAEDNTKENVKRTKELLKKRKILFEAGIQVNDLYSRADILIPVGKDQWDVIEVKSGTKVKDVNIYDVSFQKYVYEKADLKIRNCFLMYVNKEYVKRGEINPKEFLILDDITAEVEEAIDGIEDRIKNMLKILSSNTPPDAKISQGCTDPYACPLEDCWKFLPESNILHLYRINKKKAFELVDEGVHALGDLPEDFKLSDKQGIQVECEKTGKPYIHKERIKHFLKTLQYPLYYLDFETFSTAVPIFDGTKPYQPIPFQFSLHVDDGKKVKHYGFLAEGKDDPRKKFLEELKKVLDDKGNIIVYNQAFEKRILKELGESFPDNREWVESVLTRIIDLLVPFRNFHYYHPKQKGSASIKGVLPALTGKSYERLEIRGGEDASASYFNITFGDVPGKRKVREELEKYCCLDTEGMVWIVEELRKLV